MSAPKEFCGESGGDGIGDAFLEFRGPVLTI